MVLYEIGYTSICANNEAQIITSDKYKARYTFMDNDAAGIASAGKYNLPALFVPKEPDVKDPSDYAKKYGLQALKQFIDVNTSKQI
jgi:DNA primase